MEIFFANGDVGEVWADGVVVVVVSFVKMRKWSEVL